MTKTAPTAPDRTLQQRLDALARANRIRTGRAQIKRDIKAGRMTPQEALSLPEVESMRTYDFLMSIPKYGRVKANRVLNATRISPSRTIGGLTGRQLVELITYLPVGRARR
jgi:hypothetical protein